MIMIDPKMLELSIYKDIPHLLLPVITDAEAGQPRAALGRRRDGAPLRRAQRRAGPRHRRLQQEAPAAAATSGRRRSGRSSPRRPRRASRRTRTARRRGRLELLARRRLRRRRQSDEVLGGDMRGAKLGEKPEKMPYIVDHHRRVRRLDDGREQGGRGERRAHRRQGPRGGHPPDRRDPAAERRRDHRDDQEQLPVAHRLPGDQRHRLAHDPRRRRAPSSCSAWATCCTWTAAAAAAGARLLRLRGGDLQGHGLHQEAGPAGVQPSDHGEARRGGAWIDEEDRRADPLYDKAVQIVAETRKVSTSMIQRRLNVGYNRAAKIVEQMEDRGRDRACTWHGPREVLVQAAVKVRVKRGLARPRKPC
jgi:S-DNA-T family DNA segregation ATPase FtsK/SpoIIIE